MHVISYMRKFNYLFNFWKLFQCFLVTLQPIKLTLCKFRFYNEGNTLYLNGWEGCLSFTFKYRLKD